MLAELQSLAALAASNPQVALKVGEADCNWSFNWATCTITANPTDLALRPPDYCRGLILHESAHATLTRVGDILPRALHQADLHLLMNVVEDCRIENWLQQRFPGCRPWIRLYNDRLFASPSDEQAAHIVADPAGGFLAGLLDRWWHAAPLLTLHPESRSAIAEVAPYFDQAIAAFPSPEVPDALRARTSYHAHPVSICYRALDYQNEPSPEECLIRMLQHQAWAVTWRHIVPVFRRLLDHPGSEPTRRTLARLDLENTSAVPSSGNERAGAARKSQPRRAGDQSKPGNSPSSAADGAIADYLRAVSKQGALIESCGAELLRFLTAETRPRRTRFHRSGHALDLRVAMQCEADPRQFEKLWQRTTLPQHPDPAFVLLIDRSGSMRGAKAEASFAAVVVMREVCLRLGIPLSIIAFDAEARVLQSCDTPHAAGVLAKLAGLLKPSGGTHISPALDLAKRIFEESPHRHRHLWILSDGDTQQLEEAQRQLRSLRDSGVMIHGLGLGPDSQEIATLVSGAQTGLTPQQLPSVFAHLLRANLTDSIRPCPHLSTSKSGSSLR